MRKKLANNNMNIIKNYKKKILYSLCFFIYNNFSEVDLGRHIVCEICDETVTGGYDPETNQVNVSYKIFMCLYY